LGPVSWEMSLCFSINAPANLLRNLIYYAWDKFVYSHCSIAEADSCIKIGRLIEMGMFLLGIAISWYIVGLEIEAGRRCSPAKAEFSGSLRATMNLLLLSVGAVLVFIVVANLKALDRFVPPLHEIFFYFAWGVALIIISGRDLFRCFNRTM